VTEVADLGYTTTCSGWTGVQVGAGLVPVCTITNHEISVPKPSMSLAKTDNLNPAKHDHVGQVVRTRWTAKNTGNVTFHDVVVTDGPALDAYSCAPVGGSDLNAGSFLDTLRSRSSSSRGTASNARRRPIAWRYSSSSRPS